MIKFRVRYAMEKGNQIAIMLRPTGTTGNITADSDLPLFHLDYTDGKLVRVSELNRIGRYSLMEMDMWIKDGRNNGYTLLPGLEISSENFNRLELCNIISDTTITKDQIHAELSSMDCYTIKTENQCL